MEDVKILQIDTSQAQNNINNLNKGLDSVSAKLDTIGKNVKQTGTNISAGFNTAGKAMDTFKASSGQMSQVTNTLQSSLTGVNGTLKGLTSSLPFLKDGLTGAASGIAGMTAQALAFIATPIGAVIAAIGVALKLLADAFKRNEDAMTGLQKLMAPFKALWQSLQRIFDNIVNSLSGVINQFTDGEKKISIFSFGIKQLEVTLGLLKASFKILERNIKFVVNGISTLASTAKNFIDKTPLKGFVDSLANGFTTLKNKVVNLINTVANSKLGKALGWDIIVEEVKETVTGTDELIKNNKQIAEQENALAKMKRENTVEIAENEKKIAELRAKAADKETYSAKERIGFLEEAGKIEQDNLERTKKERQAELDLVKLKNSLTASGADDLQAEADAQAALTKAETDYANSQKKLNKELSAARKEAKKDAEDAAAAKKADEESAKQEAKQKTAEEKQQAQEALDIRLEQNKRIQQSDEERLNNEIAIEKERLLLYEEGTLAYEQQQTKIQELTEKKNQIILDKDKELQDARKALFDEFSPEETELEKLNTEESEKLTRLQESYNAQLISEEEFQKLKTNLQEEYAEKRKQLGDEEIMAQVNAYAQMANDILGVGKNIASLFADTSEEAFETQKAFEISSAVISTLMGAIGAYTGAASNPGLNAIPIVGPALAQAMGVTSAALVTAGGIAQIAEISKRKFGDKSTSVSSKLSSSSASNVSASAMSSTVMEPSQYSQAVSDAEIETKIGDTKVYVTEEDITNTQRKVSVQETENRY